MKRPLTLIIALVSTFIIIQIYWGIERSGIFYAIEPHFSGQCEAVSGVTGAEDITIDQTEQYAYISADDRRATMANKPVTGGIYGFDLSNPKARPILLTKGFSEDFHPHGISLYQGDHGEKSLFVVNHLNNGLQQVEIFDISTVNILTHRASITYPELTTPNDLVAVGPSQFYATNDHGYPHTSSMQVVEEYLGLPLSTISFFDGTKGKIVASNLSYANGITISADLKTVYVAEILSRQISVYTRDISNNELTKQSEIDINTGGDNLEWDDAGNLWVGAHPKLLDFVAHAKDPAKDSPSQVLKITVNTDQPKVSEIYLSTGNDISASTVAAVSGKTLLIGSVFEDKILKCEL